MPEKRHLSSNIFVVKETWSGEEENPSWSIQHGDALDVYDIEGDLDELSLSLRRIAQLYTRAEGDEPPEDLLTIARALNHALVLGIYIGTDDFSRFSAAFATEKLRLSREELEALTPCR